MRKVIAKLSFREFTNAEFTLLLWIFFFQAADYVSTVFTMDAGYVECNPIAGWIIQQNALLAVKFIAPIVVAVIVVILPPGKRSLILLRGIAGVSAIGLAVNATQLWAPLSETLDLTIGSVIC